MSEAVPQSVTGTQGQRMSGSGLGTAHSPPSPPDTSSSATMSPVYPDRPIRPLPRRSLRERLSPEISESIPHPPAPASTNPLFYSSYADAIAQRHGLVERHGTVVQNAIREIDRSLAAAQREGEGGDGGKNGYRFKGNEADSDDEEGLGMLRRYEEYQQLQRLMPLRPREGVNGNGDPPVASGASSNDSADGYDSFENTNNKKKRKIPTSGPTNQALSASLSADLASLDISDADPPVSHPGEHEKNGYLQSNGAAEPRTSPGPGGTTGLGRNRLGRHGRRDGGGRSPLAVSTNGSNTWSARRVPGPKRDGLSTGSAGNKIIDRPSDQGIISAAIAEAAALPSTPRKGQEHVSLLDQQANKKASPAKTQFTFTCESDSAKNAMWPSEEHPLAAQPHPAMDLPAMSPPSPSRGFSTQGTQTSPTVAGHQAATAPPPANTAPPGAASSTRSGKKSRRSLAKQYALAARDRRMQQEYTNYHHPPRPEDIWICEFCEYESIFGHPPTALIRSYEAKDLQERERLEEKRRLLEKAKLKGRKNKKGSKNAKNNNSTQNSTGAAANTQAPAPPPAANSAQQPHAPAPAAAPAQGYPDEMSLAQSGRQSDEYYPEYNSQPPTPLAGPSATGKIPQPVATA